MILVVALCVVMIITASDGMECTPELYWELKAELYCEEGLTLACLKQGVADLMQAEHGVAVKDVTIIANYTSSTGEMIRARVLYEDGLVDSYEIRMSAWGCNTWDLYASIAGVREQIPGEYYWFDGHPDKINVGKEWIVSTNHYDAWGAPEDVPDLEGWWTPYDANSFFGTVSFKLHNKRTIDIVPMSGNNS